VGAGPASLACAAELRQQGFQVTVMDRRPLPGGLNTYGVAEYKLRAEDSVREAEHIHELGVRFETREIDAGALVELEHEYDAVFLGMGLGAMQKLEIEGATEAAGMPAAAAGVRAAASGVLDALEFIASYKTGERLSAGLRVVVVGAGNTAIDAAVAAKRLGAHEVTIIYRRRRENISAFDFEYEHALNEGVRFLWETLPVRLENGRLTCARAATTPEGKPLSQAAREFTLECDVLIPAIGQSPLLELLQQARGVKLEGGRVVIDRATGQTANPKYFAGGDCVNGGREVVDAVADGKRAALGIAAWLEAKRG
jgi:glutamate synthase (NADPH/NADH) small chain